MAEENKDLGDKAEDAFDAAKDKAKDLGDKAGNALDSAKEKAGEFAEEAKEKASEFAEDAKEAAKDFKEDVKETFDPNKPDSGKTVAIISHLTFIGWIVAIIMNSSNKTELGSFYIRQTLGIWILTIVLGWIPIVGCFAFIICLVLVVMSVINAANEKMVPTPVLGDYFQDWFKSL